jgi:hypothetical protein
VCGVCVGCVCVCVCVCVAAWQSNRGWSHHPKGAERFKLECLGFRVWVQGPKTLRQLGQNQTHEFERKA